MVRVRETGELSLQIRSRTIKCRLQQRRAQMHIRCGGARAVRSDDLRLLEPAGRESHHFERNICCCTKGELDCGLSIRAFRRAGLRHIASRKDPHRRFRLDGLQQLLLDFGQSHGGLDEARPISRRAHARLGQRRNHQNQRSTKGPRNGGHRNGTMRLFSRRDRSQQIAYRCVGGKFVHGFQCRRQRENRFPVVRSTVTCLCVAKLRTVPFQQPQLRDEGCFDVPTMKNTHDPAFGDDNSHNAHSLRH